MDKIIILDFGSQYTQLLGRRIRDLGVYSEILPGEKALESAASKGCLGFILSGSPFSAMQKEAPALHPSIWNQAFRYSQFAMVFNGLLYNREA